MLWSLSIIGLNSHILSKLGDYQDEKLWVYSISSADRLGGQL